MEALEHKHFVSAGEHLARAAATYHFAKYLFVNDMSQMRAAHRRAVACLNLALPHLDPPCSPTNTRTADRLYNHPPAASSTSHAVSGQGDAIASRCHKHLSKAIRRRS